MPYRNALRDNFDRFQEANDAEMRMYARERMAQRPEPMYAQNGGLSMSDIGYDEQGNLVILSEQPNPNAYTGERRSMGQRPQVQQQADPYAEMSNVQRHNAQLAAALQEY